MRRVYGYKKRNHASGKRYQDGINAQARSDKDIVINSAVLVAEPEDEVIEIKSREPVAPVQEPEVVIEEEDPDEDTGDLPKHLTDFMPTAAMNPEAVANAPEEADPEAE